MIGTDSAVRQIAGLILKTGNAPPDHLFDTAVRHIVDFVGVTIAAVEGAAVRKARSLEPALSAGGGIAGAHFFGQRAPIQQRSAALLNGLAAHFHDFDDDDPKQSIGHPSSPVLAAAFAAGEQVNASGSKFIGAYIAGVEMIMRLAGQVNPNHYEQGWHSTGTLGAFGAVAAAGVLLELKAEELSNALNIVASLTSGLKQNFGTDTKPLHVGVAAHNGLWAAELASRGFTGADDAIFGNHGFCRVYGGHPDPTRFLAEWGNPFGLESPGMSIKRYPCCSSSHTAIDGVVGIMRTTGWNAREVAGIDVWIGEDITRILLYDYPKSALEGKFSLRYCVATAALHGPPTLAAFEGEAFSSRSIIEMMRKVNIHVDPELPRSPNGVTEESRVRITMLSGERVERRVPVPLGSPSLPMPQEELNEKFLNCLHGIVGVTQGRCLLSCLREFSNASSIANIVSEIVAAIGERD